ncbi:MAG TPA: polymorphic toxin-type HINT domain-containing protein [Mycobacteriales bacterium]
MTRPLHKAQETKKKSVTEVIVKAGGQVLSAYLGIDDVKNCFTKGDVLACVSMLTTAVPWLKIGKLPGLVKVLNRAYHAYTNFMKERRKANKILEAVAEACPVKSVSSFVPGTMVLMADRTHKPIEQIKPGDKVLATDPATGQTVARTVVATRVSTGVKHLVGVTVATHGLVTSQTGTVTATDTHPFWVADPHPAAGPNLPKGHWTEAGDLHPGDLLRTPAGTLLPILTLTTWTQADTVHNLTIDTDHTYDVLAGNTPVLVHNAGDCPNWSPTSGPTFGHTFKTHGAGVKNTQRLIDRARSTGKSQGQWLDNDAAAEFLKSVHVEGAGPRSVRIPDGLGQVIMPDGTIVQARAATVVPNRNGLYKTSFPIIGPN